MADEDYEEDDLNNEDGGRSGSKSKGQKRKSGNPNKGDNPNPEWQKKFGRTSRDNNIYNIPDIEENECGSSTEWCTPQSSTNCSVCLVVIAVIGIILTIYSLAIRINDWKEEYGDAPCGGDDLSFDVNEKLETTEIWDYLSALILVACIVSFIVGLIACLTEKKYIIDKNGETEKDLNEWKVSTTRLYCRCEICLWVFIFVLLIVWFWMMVGIVAGLDTVAKAKNCSPDTVQDAAGKKLLAFGLLITCAVIGGLCCGVPLVCVMIFGRPDDAKDNNDKR